jgi:hypothetical protein
MERLSVADATGYGETAVQSQIEDNRDAEPVASPLSADAGVNVSITTMVIGWAIGLAALAALIGFTLHFGEIEAFFATVRSADPG